MLLNEKKESAKNVGITYDYTFLQHQSLPCVHTFVQTCTDVAEGKC